MSLHVSYLKDGAVSGMGEACAAFGFMDWNSGVFVTDARRSVCGRFRVDPSEYGLTSDEADQLDHLNDMLSVESCI